MACVAVTVLLFRHSCKQIYILVGLFLIYVCSPTNNLPEVS